MYQILKAEADTSVLSIPLKDDNRAWALMNALLAGENKEKRFLPALYKFPILALDPGETTGLAYWDPLQQSIYLCQLATKEIGRGYDKLWRIINYASLDNPRLMHVRYEDYRVYGHMTKEHSFAHLHTPQFIGAIEVACHLARVETSNCLAVHAKTFWTDDKLKMCDLYAKGQKHARDAQRHLLRFMGEGLAYRAAIDFNTHG